MKKTDEVGWGEWVARGIGIFCVVVCLLAFFPGWKMVGQLFAERDAPAWVQAVGSILAIFSAIGIAAWQRHEEIGRQMRAVAESERAKAERIREVRIACESFIGTAAAAIQGMEAALASDSDKVGVRLRASVVSEAIEMVRAINMGTLSDTDTATVLVVRSLCAQLLVLVQEEVSSPQSTQLSLLRKHLPYYNDRMREAEAAWNGKRLMNRPSESQLTGER